MKKKAKPERKKKRTRISRMPSRIWNVLRSFQVTELFLDLDTGNYIANAYLFPLFYGFSKGNKTLMINYAGRNDLKIIIQNRLISIMYAFVK